jgi:uncharacterized protein (TIGR03437 family)
VEAIKNAVKTIHPPSVLLLSTGADAQSQIRSTFTISTVAANRQAAYSGDTRSLSLILASLLSKLPLFLIPVILHAAGCIPPPSGLVGWWPGDTTNNDIIGGNNPSTVTNISLVPGEVLDGFTFGTRAEMLIPSSPSLANQHFTWVAWVKPQGPTPGNDKSNDDFGSVIVSQNIDSSDNAVYLSWRSIDSRFVFLSGSVTSAYIASTHTFPTGQFYLVAATYDGATFQLFVNGVIEGSLSQAKTIPYSSSGWTFGANLPIYYENGNLYTRTFNGVIDEIKAFNRALSASELLAIYNAAGAGECKPVSINPGQVISAGAFGAFPAASPGSWIEIYGSNLASDTRSWGSSDFSGANAPTSLDGTSVTIGGQSAFIDYISPGQVNALVPSNAPTGLQQMTVTVNGAASAPYGITINATEPGILAPSSFNVNGTQYVVALHTDGTYVLPAGAIAGLTSKPAQPGEVITLYGIGFGPVTPAMPAGQIVGEVNSLASSFQMSIGGMAAALQYDGLAPGFTGLYQFNATVPNVASGNAVPLRFILGGVSGTQTLYLAVGS